VLDRPVLAGSGGGLQAARNPAGPPWVFNDDDREGGKFCAHARGFGTDHDQDGRSSRVQQQLHAAPEQALPANAQELFGLAQAAAAAGGQDDAAVGGVHRAVQCCCNCAHTDRLIASGP